MAEGGFARRLRDALEPRLADLGDAVVARTPSARWHVEFPNSRVYDFDALLVFTPMSDRTAEVVVVSVTLRRSPDVMWTIDAVDRESLALMEVKDHAGVKFAVDSGAHSTAHLAYLPYDIGQASAAGSPDDLINTWPLARLSQFLRKNG